MSVRDEHMKVAFIQYLRAHPNERLFQAIRNFSGYPFLVAMYKIPRADKGEYDTFYIEEGKDIVAKQHEERIDGIEEATTAS